MRWWLSNSLTVQGLGEEAEEAGPPYHGSPDLGDAATGEGRESIEVRVVAFW